MIVMEGMLSAPPERGTIIGRAVWKPRYVVLGTGSTLKTQNDLSTPTETSNRSRKGLRSTNSKPNLAEPEGKDLYITIYKAKGDWEFIAQHPLSAFKFSEVKNIQYRKQSPSLPTLVLELKPDTLSEKQRKRRSSRTGGLGPKDIWANSFLFRSIPEDRYSIYDWQIAVQPMLTAEDSVEESPISPISPVFNFSNPFANRSGNNRQDIYRSSTQPTNSFAHAPPSRPSALVSPSPSLRSRRSDLSSQASSQAPPMGFSSVQYQTSFPTDLPSPASTSGYDNQLIEGWTSAQGRSSTLSSHTRGSNSIASAIAPISPNASTPPGPRETILDRAFQMRCIPGSERLSDKDDEKISSIARFEALMREHDERKAAAQISEKRKSSWNNLKEESEGSGADDIDNDDDDDDLDMSDQEGPMQMPSPAQRALDYASGRRISRPPSSSNRPLSPSASRPLSPPPRSPPVPFMNTQAMSALHGLRPRTGTGTTSSRTGSNRPASIALPSRSISTSTIPNLKDYANLSLHPKTHNHHQQQFEKSSREKEIKEKRRSSTSVDPKRLSFQEFAKRLSSTSSLLLVQTNNSSSSGRDSSEFAPDDCTGMADRGVGLRGGEKAGAGGNDKRCAWRGSVRGWGAEGGFL